MSHSRNWKSLLFVCLLVAACATPAALAGASLDIRPSICPNLINRDTRAVLPVALVGDVDFVVSHVVPASLELSRADGVGGSARPQFRRGKRTVRPSAGLPARLALRLVDIAAPRVSGMCSTLGADGIRDLRILFRQSDVVTQLELGALPLNATVELCLSGQSDDGTPFSACDHVSVTGLTVLTSPELDDIDTLSPGRR